MIRFWDSSAIIPLLAQQPGTASCQALLLTQAEFSYWWVTPVEAESAISRLYREGVLTGQMAGAARRMAEEVFSVGTEVEPSDEIRRSANWLLRLHPLRAADALQLASAIQICAGDPHVLEFVCLDNRLRDAALAEGATVLP